MASTAAQRCAIIFFLRAMIVFEMSCVCTGREEDGVLATVGCCQYAFVIGSPMLLFWENAFLTLHTGLVFGDRCTPRYTGERTVCLSVGSLVDLLWLVGWSSKHKFGLVSTISFYSYTPIYFRGACGPLIMHASHVFLEFVCSLLIHQ